MEVTYQFVCPVVKVYSYKDIVQYMTAQSDNEPALVKVPTKIVFSDESDGKTKFDILQSYQFSESTENMDGSFSFSVAGQRGDGDSVYDMISPFDIVAIYEGNESMAVFVGVVHTRNISANMGGSGVSRSVSFSGTGCGGLFRNFIISMDKKLIEMRDATGAKNELATDISNVSSIEDFIYTTYENYCGVAVGENVAAATAVQTIISCIYGNKFAQVDGSKIGYPLSYPFYQQGENEITGVWKNILPPPYYEIFSRVDEGAPHVIVRTAPFGADNWKKLESCKIMAKDLIGYAFQRSDDEVYTRFTAYLEGSVLSSDQYVTIDQCAGGTNGITKINADKEQLYGYRPLIMSVRGFSAAAQKKDGTNNDSKNAMSNMSEELKKWFEYTDMYTTGSIIIVNRNFERGGTENIFEAPKIGCKCGFLGGEFYVRSVEHSWTYGATPQISISVGRGGMYNDNGEFTGPIARLGKSLREMEEVSK